MIDIVVRRYSGDRPGRDIVDGLIGSLQVALARGRNELDEKAQVMRTVVIDAVYRDGLRLGQLARFQDTLRGVWIGKITGIQHKYDNGELISTITAKRPVV